jgi:hypothetical protein
MRSDRAQQAERDAVELAAAVCRVLAQRNLTAVNSGDLFDELRRDPVVYGFTPELQKLSAYQIFDRLNRACRLGLLVRRRQPGGPIWWEEEAPGAKAEAPEGLLSP